MNVLKKIGKIFLNNMTDIVVLHLMMKMIKERVKEQVVLWIHIMMCLVSLSFLFCFYSLYFNSPKLTSSRPTTVEVPVVDEPTTVLDCYDFPPAFKTHHLHDIFRSYEGVRGGYKIKWLSDTRALIIFDHPSTGKLVVAMIMVDYGCYSSGCYGYCLCDYNNNNNNNKHEPNN
jgi:hypothetical protein